jgi:hypothetical protein
MTDSASASLVCANHPNRETSLRCNRCEKPICAECATLTPTGYRCKECIRGHEKTFDTTEWFDIPLAIVIGGVLSYIGSLLAARVGFFTLLLAPGAGWLIAEIVRRAVNRRRSKSLYTFTAGAVALGSVPLLLRILIVIVFGGGFGGIFALLWQLYYAVVVTSTAYTRLSGLQLRR